MKKLIFGVIAGGILGLAAGFGVGIFVYPYIFLDDVIAADQTPSADKKALASGRFVHADPGDPVHYGKGMVTVYADTVHLGADFEVGPGPKFHVYLVPKNAVTSARDVTSSEIVDLGRLRAFKGSQTYAVPTYVDIAKYGSVVIWCEAFGVLISPAALVPAAG